MITHDAEQYVQHLVAGRLLALDVGGRYVGIAVSDALRSIASPYRTYELQSKAKTAAYLRALLAEYRPAGLVVGWPLAMSGEQGLATEMVQKFLSQIVPTLFSGPVLLYDERLSTRAVTRAMQESGINRKDRTTQDNHLAATLILQGALERLRNL